MTAGEQRQRQFLEREVFHAERAVTDARRWEGTEHHDPAYLTVVRRWRRTARTALTEHQERNPS